MNPTSRHGDEKPLSFVSDLLEIQSEEFDELKEQFPGVRFGMFKAALRLLQLEKELDLANARVAAAEKELADLHGRAAGYKESAEKAKIDHVTGLLNRGAFLEEVSLLKRGAKYKVVMGDLSGTKGLNDHRSHDAGDAYLSETAKTIVRNVRKGSLVCRYGGDEFAIVIPVEDEDDEDAIRDRLDSLFDGSETAQQCRINDDESIYMRARFGYADVDCYKGPDDVIKALRIADDEMNEKARLETTRGQMPPLVHR